MYNNITSDDYTFADNGFNEMWAIKLKTKYENVTYCYGKVKAKVDDDDGNATLSFQYQVLDEGDYDKEELESSTEFNNYIGDVLSHILTDAFENENYRIGSDTDDSTKESTNK